MQFCTKVLALCPAPITMDSTGGEGGMMDAPRSLLRGAAFFLPTLLSLVGTCWHL